MYGCEVALIEGRPFDSSTPLGPWILVGAVEESKVVIN